MERVLSGTALFAWAVVAQRLESLLGKDVAAPLLGDLRQYLLGRGFDQLLNLTNELTAQRRADSILNQACDLFEHRITQSNEPHLRRFAQLSLRKIEDIQLAINAFTIIPSQITLEQVVRNQLAAIHENDPVAQLALDEAVALFMECLDLALLAKGDQTVLLLKIEEILTQLRVLQAPTLLVVPIESDQLVVASEALFAREQDIEQAVTILDPRSSQGSNVLMLYGELGAGKSTLAREIGRRLRDSSAIKSIIIRDFPFHDKEETLYETFFSKLESKLGIRTIEGHIESRAARLQQELKDRSLLYIVDDVEYDITRRIVLFMQSLNAPNVRVLITQNTAPEQPGCMTLEIKELRNTEHIHTFLQNRCNNLLLSEAQVQHILNVTQGNLIALEELAKLINENGLDKTLPQIEEAIAGPGSTIAEKWLGYVLGKLSPLQILLIHAQCLFKRTAHVNMLVEIIRHYQRDAPTTERESTDDRKIRTAVKQLVARGIFLQAKDADRYSLKSTFLNYIRQELKRDKSLDGWRDGWIACYLELRQRQQNNDDIVGWTIMLDYTPDNASPIDPAHPHEAATIRDALTYCTDPKRIATRWEDAVRLLDSFRATLFAAGLWQVRIDAAIATLKYAKSTQSWHHVGQLQRMLAWMDCFRDKYGSGEELAQSAYALSCQHLAYGRTQAERVIHCQTMYKSLVSLGQLALRQGQEAAISGHYRQHDEAERANDLFSSCTRQICRGSGLRTSRTTLHSPCISRRSIGDGLFSCRD